MLHPLRRGLAGAAAGRAPLASSLSSSSSTSSSLLLLWRGYRASAPARKSPPLPPFTNITHSNPRIERLLRQYFARVEEGVTPPMAPTGAAAGGSQATSGAHGGGRIFVNNALNLGKVEVIGMDYDYTLVGYTDAMEAKIYQLARDHLVESLDYPAEIGQRQYDPSFAIRGLAVDTDKGLLLKLSYIHAIALRTVFRGRRRLTKEEVLAEYGGSGHVSPSYRDQHLKPLVDLFCLSEACLVADVLDVLAKTGLPHDPRAVVEDVLKAVNNAHVSGKMHSAVLANPSKYMLPAPHLRQTLQRFRDVGKKLFLCSNSGYEYVAGGLKYLLGDDWRSFFEVIIVSAGKPGFFTSDRPFRSVAQATGKIRWTHVQELEPGKIYAGGSMQKLSEMTGWQSVLYFGDSLWADLVDARRLKGWRTGAVIRELEDELRVQQSPEYRQYAHKAILMTELLRLVQEEMERIRAGRDAPLSPAQREEDERVLSFIEKYLRRMNIEMSKLFSKNFGSVFRAEGEPTLFAFSLRRWADIYTSRLENLRFYSPTHRFYPSRGVSLPHDPYINNIVRSLSGMLDEGEARPSGPAAAASESKSP